MRPAVLSIVLLSLLAGCARVAPYRRESLAHRCMQVAPEPGHQAGRDHVLSVREAAAAAHGAQGGGCGCN